MWRRRLGLALMSAVCVLLVSCCPGKKISHPGLMLKSHTAANDATVYLMMNAMNGEGEWTMGSGTGVAIARDNRSKETLILTAGHVCAETYNPEFLLSEIMAFTVPGEGYYTSVVDIDMDHDLCLIKIKGMLPITKIAKEEPETGEKVTYSGYPTGAYRPGTLHYFDGYMAGVDAMGNHLYNIPATGGSSGSPIYNKDGRIVGIISAVMVEFEHMTIAVGTENVKNFIRANQDWASK